MQKTKNIEARRNLPKFGVFENTTKIADEVLLHLNMVLLEEEEKPTVTQSIQCRKCNGQHWTSACPFKDTVKEPEAAAKTGKYVPLHIRRGETNRRDDANTIRISNLSQDATENDVRNLVSRFGELTRVVFVLIQFCARDRDLNICKGFAFVSFVSRVAAQNAIDKLNGYGYDSLILSVEFSNK
jgi:translation initiation factor 3 subunit G